MANKDDDKSGFDLGKDGDAGADKGGFDLGKVGDATPESKGGFDLGKDESSVVKSDDNKSASKQSKNKPASEKTVSSKAKDQTSGSGAVTTSTSSTKSTKADKAASEKITANKTTSSKVTTDTVTGGESGGKGKSKLVLLIAAAIALIIYFIIPSDNQVTDNPDLASSIEIGDDMSSIDTDGDGMPDAFENDNGLDPSDPSDASSDSDGDGISNADEANAGTDLTNSDGDSQSDGAELASNSDPNDVSSTNVGSDDNDITDANMSVESSSSSSATDVNPSVAEKPSSTKITLSSGDDVYYFKSGSSFIRKSDKQLNKLAKELMSNKTNVQLIGHTDNSGSESLNLRLSNSRAESVYNFLINKGVSSAQISFSGEGESSPKYSNDSEENRRKNRRVEIKY